MLAAVKDSEKMASALVCALRADSCMLWVGLATFTFAVFWFLSSGSFSFVLTVSSLVSVFSFLGVALHVDWARSAQGVSCRMMECYCLVFASRLCAIVPFEGYLPYDSTGDWFYQLCEGCGLCLAGAVVCLCRLRYAASYDHEADRLHSLWLALPALGLSLAIHPCLNGHVPSDAAWAFALYLESVAVLCQFSMWMRKGKAHPHISHFLAAQALSKFLSFVFWAASFADHQNPDHYVSSFVGMWVVAVQLLHLLVMVDFIHNYLYCVWYNIPVSSVLRVPRGDERV